MKPQNMFGVVLWSDAAAQKAVIWCEDQGELAFYTPGDGNVHDAPVLDAGDLIRFDVIVQQNVRKASNPEVLMPSHSPDLPKKLRAGSAIAGDANPPVETSKSEKVVSLFQYFGVETRTKLACSG
ncbi:MAG: hypothetical protein MRY75_10040 [Marivita sp.]|uniref:hypothetical protein n=1 Tax=Marivita sp. TaxID=2003365 RepID=UPI0025C2AC07|nr:hypothetical protein [Marivita sp.]MCI5110879.1 hypothetical protein [Marivita sp.]